MSGTILPEALSTFVDANGKPLAGGSVYMYIPNTSTPKNTWQDSLLTILNTNPIILNASGQAAIWGTGQYRQVVYDQFNNLIWDAITEDTSGGLVGNMTDNTYLSGSDFTPGTTTQLTLSTGPGSAANMWVFFDAAFQAPDTWSLNLATNVVTFNSPIPVGVQEVNIKVGSTVAIGTPGSGTVTDASVAANAAIQSSKLSFLQAGAGAVQRTVLSKLQDEVNAADFVSAGSTDFSVAVNAALAHLIALGGGKLQIDPGTYTCKTPIVMPNTGSEQSSANIMICGAPGYSTVLNFSSATNGTDAISIPACDRWVLQDLVIQGARNYGINLNAGETPGGANFTSRWTIERVIVDGSVSDGIWQANTYMGRMVDVESRNNGGNGFTFAGFHTTITCIRCWGGGDGVYPNAGGNQGWGWVINGITYSAFIGCAADNNGDNGWSISNAIAIGFLGCGAESNGREGFLVLASTANQSGIPYKGIAGVSFKSCFGYNNSQSSINLYANFLGVVTANSVNAALSVEDCSDTLGSGQTVSLVLSGTAGQINFFESGNRLNGTYAYSGTVVTGDFLSSTVPSGSQAPLTTATPTNAGPAIALPSGDWDVYGTVDFNPGSGTAITSYTAAISTTANTIGGQDTFSTTRCASFTPGASSPWQQVTPITRVRSQGSTSVFLVAQASFSGGNLSAYGSIFAKKA